MSSAANTAATPSQTSAAPVPSSAAPEPSSASPAQSSAAPNTPSSAAPASSAAPSSAAAPASSAAPSSAAPAASSAAPPASSAAPPASSAAPAPSSSEAPATSSAAPAPSSAAPATTQVITASSAPPTATEVAISVVTITPSASNGQSQTPIIVTSVVTREGPAATGTTGGLASTATTRGASSSTNTAGPQTNNGVEQKGLSTGGKTAIAVVVPVVVVALLVLAGIILWRKRKARQNNEEERRKEVEEYGFNPNHDPTLPAVGVGSEMAEDSSGYRGWGNTATSSNRKASTTLTSGMTYSDSNSNPGGYNTPHSPTGGAYSEGSNDPLVNGRRETMDSDGLGALGAVGGAAPNSTQNQVGVQRGPSNASSSYSAANRSDTSGEYPGYGNNDSNQYYDNQGYYQTGPYGNPDPYGANQQPVIRDVSARRNTRIENPSVFPQQGNSGIAQNF